MYLNRQGINRIGTQRNQQDVQDWWRFIYNESTCRARQRY